MKSYTYYIYFPDIKEKIEDKLGKIKKVLGDRCDLFIILSKNIRKN